MDNKQLKQRIQEMKKPYIIDNEAIMREIRRLGAEETMYKTGFDEAIIRSWIYGVYQPTNKQIVILQKALFNCK